MSLVHRQSAMQSLWMLGAGLSFAIMTQCIKYAVVRMGVFELLFYRSAGGIAIMLCLLGVYRQRLAARHLPTHFLRAVFGIGGLVMFFFALRHLPVTTAYALKYTAPLFFIILTIVFLRERLRPVLVVPIAGSLAGVALLLRPEFSQAEQAAVLVGLLSGASVGVAYLLIRRLGQLGETHLGTVAFLNLHGTLFGLLGILAIDSWTPLPPATAAAVAGVVVFATVGQLCLTRALQFGASVASAMLSYSGMVFALLFDMTINDIAFGAIDYLGFALIAGCGAWSLWLSRQAKRVVIEDDV